LRMCSAKGVPMRIQFAAACLLSLGACVQGQPTCTSPAARELKTIDRLIADTEATIDRGFTTAASEGARINFCLGGGGNNVGVSFCADPTRRNVPIDRAAEQRKLDGLMERRAALARQAAIDSRACAEAVGAI
jgi:hypothetical protein